MESTEAPQVSEPVAIFKKRSAKGKSNFRKRAATPPPASDSDSAEYSSSEDESGHKIKRRKKNTGAITASSKTNASSTPDLTSTIYTADRSTTIKSSNDATKQSNWYDENATDAPSSKNLLGTTRAAPSSGEGTYKGLANGTSFIQKNPNAPTRVVGPVKAPTNIRTITVTDFAPDVCKDYKQTGWCGFGDSCKFLHAREDYKQGWQLDKEWENVTKGKKVTGGTKIASANRNVEDTDSEDDDAVLEGIPFACIICQEKYKDPIVTKCGHYFCESCALKRYRKDPSCAACGAGTGGVFNVAKGLKKLLDKKRERAAKRRQKAIEAGEEVSDEEEGAE
jgi:RING finger protein 113A